MSYDLAVFDPSIAPQDRKVFLSWFEQQTEWKEPHSYNDPNVSSVALQAWFFEIIREFPPMNGPHKCKQIPVDEWTVTDYGIGTSLIYAAFSWSKTKEAFEATVRLAEKHGLGFFNVSSRKSEVWLPSSNGKLVLAHSD
jgi:hypothetical protein